jgi:hypothetical protein
VTPILDDVRCDDGEFVDLMNERVWVVPAEWARTVPAELRLEGPDLIGRQKGAFGLGVPRLPAPASARRSLGRGRFPMWGVGRRRLRRVGGILVEPSLKVCNLGFEKTDIRHHRGRQVLNEFRWQGWSRHVVGWNTNAARPRQWLDEQLPKPLENRSSYTHERLPQV